MEGYQISPFDDEPSKFLSYQSDALAPRTSSNFGNLTGRALRQMSWTLASEENNKGTSIVL